MSLAAASLLDDHVWGAKHNKACKLLESSRVHLASRLRASIETGWDNKPADSSMQSKQGSIAIAIDIKLPDRDEKKVRRKRS